jgi:hypothetical protein
MIILISCIFGPGDFSHIIAVAAEGFAPAIMVGKARARGCAAATACRHW